MTPNNVGSENNFYIGIDLGTTNSLMSWGTIDPKTDFIDPKIVDLKMMIEGGGVGKRNSLPSCVYFKEREEPIVGEYAKSMIGRQTDRVVKSIKSHMGSGEKFSFDDKAYDPVEISSIILRHMANASRELFNFIPDDVVITVPASFDSDMRLATIRAADLAGFRITEGDGAPRNILLDEPRAALYDFVNRQNRNEIPSTLIDFSSPKIILVFDLGGGTLDVSLHRVSRAAIDDLEQIEDLAISRYTKIGGDDFDYLLAERFFDSFSDQIPANLDAYQHELIFKQFIKFAEAAKLDLSAQIETKKMMGQNNNFEYVDVEVYQTPFENKFFDYELTYGEYEEVIAPLLGYDLDLSAADNLDQNTPTKNIIYPILDVLRKGSVKTGSLPEVDAVLLNGGMTKLHIIQDRLTKLFGVEPISAGDPDQAVARGAVVHHYNLHQGLKPARILNETIGLQIEGGITHLVKAGTVLPLDIPREIEGLNLPRSASSLILPFFLGDGIDTNPPNREISKREVKFHRILDKGEEIYMQIKVDDRGIFHLDGWPLSTPDSKFSESICYEVSEESQIDSLINPPTEEQISPIKSETKGKSKKRRGEEHLNINQTLDALKNCHDQFTDVNFPERKEIMDKAKKMENNILQSVNGYEFIFPLLSLIDRSGNFGKGRIIILLGNLASQCSDRSTLFEICNKAMSLSHPKEIVFKHSTFINTVVRYAIETIGKTGLSFAESHLISLLNVTRTAGIQGAIIYSMGKLCDSVNSIEQLKGLIRSKDDSIRIATNWSFGRIGGREKENPLPIEALKPIINELIRQLNEEEHDIARKNCIYALGEIGDCRNRNVEIISTAQQNKIIKALSGHTKISANSLSALAGLSSSGILQRTAKLAINMIEGVSLSEEEESTLLEIRTLLSISD